MPRPVWSGSVTFGLVSVPVKLYPATERKDVRFHEMHKGTGRRIRHKRVAEGTGREVDREDMVKGYELGKGKYVTVTPEELEAIQPGKTNSIDIEDFVDLEEIDPIYFDKTYYLMPNNDRGAAKPYALLRKAMQKSEKIAVGQFVMRSKQYLVAVRPSATDGVLLLETMFYPDEIREMPDVKIPDSRPTDRELRMADQLIGALGGEWGPKKYRDTYRERVLDLIKQKSRGKEIVVEPEQEQAEVPSDLMEALRASYEALEKPKGRRASSARRKQKTAKRRPAKRKKSA